MAHVLVYYTLLVVIIICIMFVKLRKCKVQWVWVHQRMALYRSIIIIMYLVFTRMPGELPQAVRDFVVVLHVTSFERYLTPFVCWFKICMYNCFGRFFSFFLCVCFFSFFFFIIIHFMADKLKNCTLSSFKNTELKTVFCSKYFD